MENSRYLGDGVYADYDGYHIRIYLDNGAGPHSIICLDSSVYNSFLSFGTAIHESIEQMNMTDELPRSQCCGTEMSNWPDIDICPICHEHTGVESEND